MGPFVLKFSLGERPIPRSVSSNGSIVHFETVRPTLFRSTPITAFSSVSVSMSQRWPISYIDHGWRSVHGDFVN